jgi:hypothetical protein
MKSPFFYVFLIALQLLSCKPPTSKIIDVISTKVNKEKPSLNLPQTQLKAKEAYQFCSENNMNLDFCILIDMSVHSGLERFLVWDFKADTITHSFLVGHGCCDNSWGSDDSKDNPTFSNVPESHCSSLGKYKVGERAYSNWGVNIKYVLHGLESTNNKAFERLIVFHSWEMMSDATIYPNGSPEGWGCPTISNNHFKVIDLMLQSAAKPTLMWMYKN